MEVLIAIALVCGILLACIGCKTYLASPAFNPPKGVRGRLSTLFAKYMFMVLIILMVADGYTLLMRLILELMFTGSEIQAIPNIFDRVIHVHISYGALMLSVLTLSGFYFRGKRSFEKRKQ